MAETVRVLSYNVRSLRDDRAALARVVRGCEPDVVCVQESPGSSAGAGRLGRWPRSSASAW
ncbi:endonuclease/exonuclease/phosphatase family protein [Catenulispora yoronensis]